MKRKIMNLLVIIILSLGLVACGSEETGLVEVDEEVIVDDGTEEITESEDEPETKIVRWAQVPNGNILYEIAQKNGYFEEYGLEVIPENISVENDSFSALLTDKVDILSGSGTSGPIQQIAAGNEITVFGGHMVTGAQAVFTRDDVEWNGIEDFVGKKYGGLATSYWLAGPLLEAGFDPLNDIEWIQLPNPTDNIAAVESGEVDFAAIVTSQHYQVENMDGIKIVAYSDDFMPNHSCCRMLTRTEFVNENPNTIKAIHKALIRAKRDFEMDRESAVDILAEAIGTSYDHVASFMLNEHFQVSADPLKNAVVNGWNILDEIGFLADEARDIDYEGHINIELYKEALDELIEERGDEDPEYYESQVKFFEENNY